MSKINSYGLQVWSSDATQLRTLCTRVNELLEKRTKIVENLWPRAATWKLSMDALSTPRTGSLSNAAAWFKGAMSKTQFPTTIARVQAYVETWFVTSMSLGCALALPYQQRNGVIEHPAPSDSSEFNSVKKVLDDALTRSWAVYYAGTPLASDVELQAAVMNPSGVFIAPTTRLALEALRLEALKAKTPLGNVHVMLLLEVPSPWAMTRSRSYNNARLTSIAGEQELADKNNAIATVLRELQEEAALIAPKNNLKTLTKTCWSLDVTMLVASPITIPLEVPTSFNAFDCVKALALTLK